MAVLIPIKNQVVYGCAAIFASHKDKTALIVPFFNPLDTHLTDLFAAEYGGGAPFYKSTPRFRQL
jgi:hypothetical protein